MLLIFIVLAFLNATCCNGSDNCNVTTSQGTKSFIEFVFQKYTEANDSSVMTEDQLNKLMKDLAIDRIIKAKRVLPEYIDIAKSILSVQIDKKECYNSKKLLSVHNINATKGISRLDFLRLSPAFIHELDSRACILDEKKHKDGNTPSKAQTWGWGFFSITVISFASLALIGIIPFIKKSIYARVMSYLVALAVGTLSGDALLHLIPHSFGEGTNQAIGIHVSEEQELKQEYSQVWRALFVLLGIYAFFAVELFMKLRGGGHGHSHGNDGGGHAHNDVPTRNGSIRKPRAPSQKSVSYANEAIEIEIPGTNGDVTKGDLPTYQSGNEVIIYQSQRKHSLRDPGEKPITGETSVRTVAWVVIIGDGFHNFSDGLAIGAAFSASMSSGISTSIAVFCHELPHELGDFAVLLNAGMTMKQAIVYNLVSTILAYAGLTVGILAGGDEIGRHFILSITAGLFLYVSLADLLPELTNEDIPGQSKICTFFIQHLGICTGIAVMLIISLFEHQMGG